MWWTCETSGHQDTWSTGLGIDSYILEVAGSDIEIFIRPNERCRKMLRTRLEKRSNGLCCPFCGPGIAIDNCFETRHDNTIPGYIYEKTCDECR